MGQAAQRKAREAAWLSELSDAERTIVATARRISEVLPLQGACYRATFFMKYHLETVHGIAGRAVVGFVNDGTDDLFCSHAWYEYGGRRTDLALSSPLRPHLQKPGPMTIHGREIQPGWTWTYHDERSPAGEALFAELLANPEVASDMQFAADLHAAMKARARSNELIRAYLDEAPDGLTYDRLAARL